MQKYNINTQQSFPSIIKIQLQKENQKKNNQTSQNYLSCLNLTGRNRKVKY